MLYDIQARPTAQNAAILLNAGDNVAIARVALEPGQEIEAGADKVVTRSAIPAGHKVAIRRIRAGERVYRYGNVIGFATRIIEPGDHVHVHNLGYKELDPEEVVRTERRATIAPRPQPASFLGYRRADGRVGTRNYIAVVAASNCAAYTSELIAQSFRDEKLPDNVDGVVAFPHGEGCGMAIGPDTTQLERTLRGVLDHPNVSAALILGLGCEVNQISHYLGLANGTESSIPATLHGMTLQESGGTTGAVETARKQVRHFIDRAAAERRTDAPASELVLGLNCGGSDSFSGITANPALGYCCDLLVAQGGTVVLAETTEIFGAEHLLVQRARSEPIARKLLECVARYKTYLRGFGGSFNDNPSPGNKEGGLTNILEKSLGAIAKAGTTPLEDVVDYAERINHPGFVFMNTPGYDPVSITGLGAGGVNLIAFTTGRGSAIGFPSIPVLKIASNSQTFRRMQGNMDLNAGRIADGEATVESVGREIFEALLRVASGERTKAELLGHHEFAPWKIGPVL
ncbi:MAG: altronate dehydratase [Acidobacteriaceae bacterium]|nr:altronate dehydratase [Acidobacteriaceae bacterium]MBV8571216.1 altronate dehydratase [Acidobacteriaceae bacterium]